MKPEYDLGPCCACGGTERVRNMIMLPLRGNEPGKGWGCVVCGLPADGALAVLCDACFEKNSPPTEAVAGYAIGKRRVPITELSGPFEHDLSRHEECGEVGI